MLVEHGVARLVGEHHVVGDVVAGQRGVLADVAQQVQHAAIGAGRLQAQRTDHGQHRRAVVAEMSGDQRDMVVTVVRGDLVDVVVLGDEPTRGHHRRAGREQRGLLLSGGRPVG
ncbi:MAG TPA: hypothetical protein VII33_02355, partial [Nakamurella sp.]